MTYVCGGAGIIMILSVCQCQEHTTANCLCDPCFHGGAVKSGIYVSAKSTCKTNVVVYMIHVPTVEENRVSLNTVSAKKHGEDSCFVVYMINGPTVEAAG